MTFSIPAGTFVGGFFDTIFGSGSGTMIFWWGGIIIPLNIVALIFLARIKKKRKQLAEIARMLGYATQEEAEENYERILEVYERQQKNKG